MKMMIYGIGGDLNEELVGVATDPTTALNLLRLIALLGGRACSIHGRMLADQAAYSGEMTLAEARKLFSGPGREGLQALAAAS